MRRCRFSATAAAVLPGSREIPAAGRRRRRAGSGAWRANGICEARAFGSPRPCLPRAFPRRPTCWRRGRGPSPPRPRRPRSSRPGRSGPRSRPPRGPPRRTPRSACAPARPRGPRAPARCCPGAGCPPCPQPEPAPAASGLDVDRVAGRARHFGHDRALLAEQGVEERRLADVGPPHDGERDLVSPVPLGAAGATGLALWPEAAMCSPIDGLQVVDADVVLGRHAVHLGKPSAHASTSPSLPSRRSILFATTAQGGRPRGRRERRRDRPAARPATRPITRRTRSARSDRGDGPVAHGRRDLFPAGRDRNRRCRRAETSGRPGASPRPRGRRASCPAGRARSSAPPSHEPVEERRLADVRAPGDRRRGTGRCRSWRFGVSGRRPRFERDPSGLRPRCARCLRASRVTLGIPPSRRSWYFGSRTDARRESA